MPDGGWWTPYRFLSARRPTLRLSKWATQRRRLRHGDHLPKWYADLRRKWYFASDRAREQEARLPF